MVGGTSTGEECLTVTPTETPAHSPPPTTSSTPTETRFMATRGDTASIFQSAETETFQTETGAGSTTRPEFRSERRTDSVYTDAGEADPDPAMEAVTSSTSIRHRAASVTTTVTTATSEEDPNPTLRPTLHPYHRLAVSGRAYTAPVNAISLAEFLDSLSQIGRQKTALTDGSTVARLTGADELSSTNKPVKVITAAPTIVTGERAAGFSGDNTAVGDFVSDAGSARRVAEHVTASGGEAILTHTPYRTTATMTMEESAMPSDETSTVPRETSAMPSDETSTVPRETSAMPSDETSTVPRETSGMKYIYRAFVETICHGPSDETFTVHS
ncbi:PREDICTED: endochitinase A-like [Priapulus caudatus]|uniref:Endochitinase A-like n=1 Tax=Priapulus caudatus TaxID=37621 RepID=A0ABM1E916_PRICU|nr:PREDICTED: endochitinase A-like [Priapulus caudatus]